MPMINFVVARKIILRKMKQWVKTWIKESGICTGKSSVENKFLTLYYSNFLGTDGLHRKLEEHDFTVSKTKIKEVLHNKNSYCLHHPPYHTLNRRRVYVQTIDD